MSTAQLWGRKGSWFEWFCLFWGVCGFSQGNKRGNSNFWYSEESRGRAFTDTTKKHELNSYSCLNYFKKIKMLQKSYLKTCLFSLYESFSGAFSTLWKRNTSPLWSKSGSAYKAPSSTLHEQKCWATYTSTSSLCSCNSFHSFGKGFCNNLEFVGISARSSRRAHVRTGLDSSLHSSSSPKVMNSFTRGANLVVKRNLFGKSLGEIRIIVI